MIKKIYGKKVYLAKIKDSYIFDKDSHKSHFYICLKDRNGKIKLRGLTHLYKPDSRRMGQLRGGLIYKRKFFNFDAVSGVNKKIIFNDINGQPLTINNINKNSEIKLFKTFMYK